MEKKVLQKAFGNNVRKLRSISGKSQEEFAYSAEISTVYLGELERGEKCPSIETAFRISTALKMPLAQLLDFDTGNYIEEEALEVVKNVLKGVPHNHKLKLAHLFEKIASLYYEEIKPYEKT